MEEQELRNFLRSEGEELTEVAVPTFDIEENLLIDIGDQIESEGLEQIIKNMGTLANSFKTDSNGTRKVEVFAQAVKVIHAGLVRLHLGIVDAQGNVKTALTNVSNQMKRTFRKSMAVLFYLIYKSFVEIERGAAAEAHDISISNAAKETTRRKKKQGDGDMVRSQYRFWFHWRPKIIHEVEKLVSPPMNELWVGASDGFNLMRCLTLAFCTTIKNKSQNLRTMDDEMEDIFDILGVLSAKHDEQKGIISRLVPLIKGSEETATIIGHGIDRMISKGHPNQASNMVLLSLTEALDILKTNMQKETAADRGFQAFLAQLCSLQPKGAMHSLAIVIQFLESESQIVRNAVLQVAFDLLKWTWQQRMEEERASQADGEELRNEIQERRDERERVGDNWLELRKKLLEEILLLHMRDTNSFVRSKAMSLLTDLVKSVSINPAEGIEIMRSLKNRLLDKTVTARKNAIGLITELVRSFPHMVQSKEKFEFKIKQKRDEIISTIQADEEDPAYALYFIIKEFHLHREMSGFVISASTRENMTDAETANASFENHLKAGRYWQACETFYLLCKKWSIVQAVLDSVRQENDTDVELYLRYFKTVCPDIFPQNVDELELQERNYVAPKKVEDCRAMLDYTQSLFRMRFELEKCEPCLRKLLELGTTTDKKEAVIFYSIISSKGFEIPGSITCSIINALAQLNNEELPEFVEPFRQIFIGRENLGDATFVKKLIELVNGLSENYVENLSGMIGELYRSRCLRKEAIQILFDAYCLSTGSWETTDSRSAGYIIGIIGQIDRAIVTSNHTQLVNVGLGKRGLEDYELAKVTLQTLLFGYRVEQEVVEQEVTKGRSKTKTITSRTKSEQQTFLPENELFTKIVDLIENGLKVEGDNKMDAMYPRVAELSMQIVFKMCSDPKTIVTRILENIYGLVFGPKESQNSFHSSERILFRYLSVGKALLGAHISYYEGPVSNAIKQRKATAAKSKKKIKSTTRQRESREMGSANSSILNHSNQDATNEMDLMIGNIGFDTEADMIKTYISELLNTGFFRQFRTHVLFLCQKFDTIKTINLKVSCVQALTKLMLVCEVSVLNSLETLINLWKGDEDFAVKLEILRASIRLSVRFPNQMEKMNDCLSQGLTHKDARVRKACMDYIQYLALSDLLKVREQLSDTAACLCDENYELREMARDFINEISEKDNVLQNCIPDIISRLSLREDISQEKFQLIMKIVLQKVKKEKQLGGLIERVVGRFKGPVTVRVCQDTAFCLTQIQQNDKTLKVLKDNISAYADKLGDPAVWGYFTDLLNSLKKLNKQELKLRIEEWEKELEEHHEKCVALVDAEKAAKRKPNQPQRMEDSSSEEEMEEGGQDDGEERPEDGGNEEKENEEAEMVGRRRREDVANQSRSSRSTRGPSTDGVQKAVPVKVAKKSLRNVIEPSDEDETDEEGDEESAGTEGVADQDDENEEADMVGRLKNVANQSSRSTRDSKKAVPVKGATKPVKSIKNESSDEDEEVETDEVGESADSESEGNKDGSGDEMEVDSD